VLLKDKKMFYVIVGLATGTNVLIFKKNSPKNSAKKMAFLTRNKAKLCKILIITLVFDKNANLFAENCRKSQKIVIATSTPGLTFAELDVAGLPADDRVLAALGEHALAEPLAAVDVVAVDVARAEVREVAQLGRERPLHLHGVVRVRQADGGLDAVRVEAPQLQRMVHAALKEKKNRPQDDHRFESTSG
jgi:hypothetical protein